MSRRQGQSKQVTTHFGSKISSEWSVAVVVVVVVVVMYPKRTRHEVGGGNKNPNTTHKLRGCCTIQNAFEPFVFVLCRQPAHGRFGNPIVRVDACKGTRERPPRSQHHTLLGLGAFVAPRHREAGRFRADHRSHRMLCRLTLCNPAIFATVARHNSHDG